VGEIRSSISASKDSELVRKEEREKKKSPYCQKGKERLGGESGKKEGGVTGGGGLKGEKKKGA